MNNYIFNIIAGRMSFESISSTHDSGIDELVSIEMFLYLHCNIGIMDYYLHCNNGIMDYQSIAQPSLPLLYKSSGSQNGSTCRVNAVLMGH